jgi:hypothetical protein
MTKTIAALPLLLALAAPARAETSAADAARANISRTLGFMPLEHPGRGAADRRADPPQGHRPAAAERRKAPDGARPLTRWLRRGADTGGTSDWTGEATAWEIAPMVSPRRPFVGRGREIEELGSGFEEERAVRTGIFCCYEPF